MAPQITLQQSGPTTAKPGDLVTFSTKITNTGSGPAISSFLKQTNPDGTAGTSDLGLVIVGLESTESTSFTVPANACPGDFTSAGAALAFKDFPGQDLTAATSTPLQILDVTAPTFDVTLSPNVLSPPDHKFIQVTATINSTDNCDHSPSVALVSITISDTTNNKEADIQDAAFGTDDRGFSLRAERDTGNGNVGRV